MIKVFIFMGLCLSTACSAQPTYREQLAAKPRPTDTESIQMECGQIRQEIVRKNHFAQNNTATGPTAQYIALASQRDIAALETRSADIGCAGAFSGSSVPPQQSSIDACISACKTNTDRTPTQCFDSCNK